MTVIRLAAKDDCAQIASLMRQSYDERTIGLTIYGCEGIDRFLRAQLDLPHAMSDSRYVVATERGRLQGFIEFKLSAPDIFLNYICISAENRGNGLARNMLCRAIDLVCADAYTNMLLDVFVDNAVARAWYQRLGFVPHARTEWWRFGLGSSSGEGAGRIDGFAQAEACQAAFGFSRFELRTSKSGYDVGRLGSHWYKVRGSDVLEDAEAMQCLGMLAPEREVLALLPGESTPARRPGGDLLQVGERMSVEVLALLRNLSGRRHYT